MFNSRPRARGVTASKLFAISNRDVVKRFVDDLVEKIDAQIHSSHAAGFNNTEYELPGMFSVGNMSKMDAQLIVYSDLLQIYTKSENMGGKGFESAYIHTTMHNNAQKYMFRISWVNGMDENEKQKRKDIIMNRTKH